MKKPITEEWERFESFVVPREASDIQRKEMRSAFFAGALSLFNSIMNQLEDTGNPDDVTEWDMAFMAAVAADLEGYKAEVRARVAEISTKQRS